MLRGLYRHRLGTAERKTIVSKEVLLPGRSVWSFANWSEWSRLGSWRIRLREPTELLDLAAFERLKRVADGRDVRVLQSSRLDRGRMRRRTPRRSSDSARAGQSLGCAFRRFLGFDDAQAHLAGPLADTGPEGATLVRGQALTWTLNFHSSTMSNRSSAQRFTQRGWRRTDR